MVVETDGGLVLKHYNRSFRNVDIDFLPNTPVPLHASSAGQVFMSYSTYQPQNQAQAQLIEQIRSRATRCVTIRHRGSLAHSRLPVRYGIKRGELVAIAVTMGFFSADDMPQIAGQLVRSVEALHLQE
ncbi:Uncharacterised protein [Citrobacter amalonaticus]|nr:Uncharacterised protein [Citrobacter amalonaticus]